MTFHLVHRSQKDPLAADEKAPQHVLLPATKVQPCCSDHKSFYSCSPDVCLMSDFIADFKLLLVFKNPKGG